ncbi:MAG: PDZ domain-containing protein [Acidimicrobiales bacterium]
MNAPHEGPSVEGELPAVAPDGTIDVYGERTGAKAPRGQDRFSWGAGHYFLAVLTVIVVAAVVAWFIQLPYYALTPGSAPAVSSLIKVPAADRHSHRGSVLLVYVELTLMRALYYPFFWLDPNATIYSSASILGTESTAQYQTEGEIDMSTAQQAATVVALEQLGYKVPVVALGALIYGILPGSPAASALKVGDVISKVNGFKVSSYLALQQNLEATAPGTAVRLEVSAYPAGKPRTVAMRLGAFRIEGTGAAASLTCLPWGERTTLKLAELVTQKGGKPHAVSCMGIYPQGSGGVAVDGTAFRIGPLPVKVDLSSEGIVGPSAGLAFTLGVMQELDRANLTGGLTVAATGTMSIDGTVGDVGGVAQKTIAVRGAGASVFLVPPQEYAVAKAHAGPHLKVYAVSTISEAVHILESLGGRVSQTTT